MKTVIQMIAEQPHVSPDFRRAMQMSFPRADFQILTRTQDASVPSQAVYTDGREVR